MAGSVRQSPPAVGPHTSPRMASTYGGATSATGSPRLHPRTVLSYERQAQLNAVRRTIAAAQESPSPTATQRREQLELLLRQLESRGCVQAGAAERREQCFEAALRNQDNKERDLRDQQFRAEVKRTELIKETRRERDQHIHELAGDKVMRTQQGAERVREREKERCQKLISTAKKVAQKMHSMEERKGKERRDVSQHRDRQRLERAKKLADLRDAQEAAEQRMIEDREVKDREINGRLSRLYQRRQEKAERLASERKKGDDGREAKFKSLQDSRREGLEQALQTRVKKLEEFRLTRAQELAEASRRQEEAKAKTRERAEERQLDRIKASKKKEEKRHQADKSALSIKQTRIDEATERGKQKEALRVERARAAAKQKEDGHEELRERLFHKREDAAARLFQCLEPEVQAAHAASPRLFTQLMSPPRARLPAIQQTPQQQPATAMGGRRSHAASVCAPDAAAPRRKTGAGGQPLSGTA